MASLELEEGVVGAGRKHRWSEVGVSRRMSVKSPAIKVRIIFFFLPLIVDLRVLVFCLFFVLFVFCVCLCSVCVLFVILREEGSRKAGALLVFCFARGRLVFCWCFACALLVDFE